MHIDSEPIIISEATALATPNCYLKLNQALFQYNYFYKFCNRQKHYAASFPKILLAYSLGESPDTGIP